MSSVAVAGGTGTLGRPLAVELARRGHEVRLLSRRSPAEAVEGATHHPVDLTDGSGLEAGLAGVEVLVDAANDPGRRAGRVLVEGTRRLLGAGARAGVNHHVCVSIVGVERVPLGYYRAKLDQEGLVEAGPVPWTVLRSTQFHPLIDRLFAAAARLGVLPAARGVRLQPIDVAEVARAVSDIVASAPRYERVDIGGPEVSELRALARVWRAGTGSRARLVALPLPPSLGRPLRDGALTEPGAARLDGPTFSRWLAERSRTGALSPEARSGGGA